jgi:hypothetical protein
VSLRATDPIHFDIEEKFRLYGLFYERRKGEYRELKKPVDQIISIQTLARAVIAILLQQPNNAYATSSRVLKSDYDRVFSENHNRDMFLVCMLLHRQVDKYLAEKGDQLKHVRSIIRCYVSIAVAYMLLKKSAIANDKELALLLPIVAKPIDEDAIENLTQLVLTTYNEHGGSETVAKGPEMRETVLKKLSAKLTPV